MKFDKLVRKARGDYDENDEDHRRANERKGPFKNYYEYDERDKKSIQRHEEFFDQTTRNKDRENFIVPFLFFVISSWVVSVLII